MATEVEKIKLSEAIDDDIVWWENEWYRLNIVDHGIEAISSLRIRLTRDEGRGQKKTIWFDHDTVVLRRA